MLLVIMGASGAMAQTNDDNPDFACVNTTQGYWVDLADGPNGTPGSTYEWTITAGPAGGWIFASGQNTNHLEINWLLAGTYTLEVIETADACPGVPVTLTINVEPNNTFTLTSAAGTDDQIVCIDSPIVDITYSTTGATGATFAGLPAGVTGNWVADVITIAGTPTVDGTFNYTVTLTGGCGDVEITGTITVTEDNTFTLTSAAGTDDQIVCIDSPIVDITYSTTGATGATFAGLPAGVTGNWVADVITIAGTPTVDGTFNYTVTLTGGCGDVEITGTITVTPLPTTSPIWHD